MHLDVFDESHLHAGHAGSRPEGESHFRLEIVSSAFAGQTRIQRQRMVYDALAEEMSTDIHALQMTILTPDEATPALSPDNSRES